jgi:transposase
MNDKQLYQQILGVFSPWSVTDVNLDPLSREVRIKIAYDHELPAVCPTCGRSCTIHDHHKRTWQHLNTCQFKTFVECDIPRSNCPEHGPLLMKVSWAEKGSKLTAMCEAFVIELLRHMTIKDTAEITGLTWHRIANVQERAVKRGLERRVAKPVINLGVDETSFQKRHEYVTVVYDRDRNVIADVLDDRKAETLGKWLENQPKEHLDAIQSITMDMWDPFIAAVRKYVPEAHKKISFDRFHVAQHFAKALDKVRAEEHRTFHAARKESPLTGTKIDWLRNSERTDNRSRRDFMRLAQGKLKTSRGWAIKETAASLWGYSYRGAAETQWKMLIRWIAKCRLEPIMKVGRMVKNYLWGILNAAVSGLTNAAVEAKNACIQRIKFMACGFRNRARFRHAILFHLGGLDLMPEGVR